MSDKGYVLGEEDIKALRLMYADWCNQRENPSNRPAVPKDVGTSPEVYVALTPSGGIPALSALTPGSAKCQIYKITTSGVLAVITSLIRTIYNLSTTVIPAGIYIQTNRDKLGNWLAITGTGGSVGGSIVRVMGATTTRGVYDAEVQIGVGGFDLNSVGPCWAWCPNMGSYYSDLDTTIRTWYVAVKLVGQGQATLSGFGTGHGTGYGTGTGPQHLRDVYFIDPIRTMTNFTQNGCMESFNTL